jgi:hypothetical protein
LFHHDYGIFNSTVEISGSAAAEIGFFYVTKDVIRSRTKQAASK